MDSEDSLDLQSSEEQKRDKAERFITERLERKIVTDNFFRIIYPVNEQVKNQAVSEMDAAFFQVYISSQVS